MSTDHIRFASSEEFERRLCEIIGISPEMTTAIDIQIRPSAPVLISITRCATFEQTEAILAAIEVQAKGKAS